MAGRAVGLQRVAHDRRTEPAHIAFADPMALLDKFYEHRASTAQGNLYTAHRCGFTPKVPLGTFIADRRSPRGDGP